MSKSVHHPERLLGSNQSLWQSGGMHRTQRERLSQAIRGTTAHDGSPRYQVVADALARDIAKGRYPVGSTLPTEYELCEMFTISRFTVREALRRLRDANLVTRKPGAGTRVISRHPAAPYTQSLASLDDLLQYAANTEMRITQVRSIDIGAAIAADLPIPVGERWLFALGTRFRKDDDLPIGLTRVYINPAFSKIASELKGYTKAIYRLIETHYDVSVARVEQRILAISLSVNDASRLKAEPADPALRIVRLYYDKRDRVLEASDSIHPAARFSYTMDLRRWRQAAQG